MEHSDSALRPVESPYEPAGQKTLDGLPIAQYEPRVQTIGVTVAAGQYVPASHSPEHCGPVCAAGSAVSPKKPGGHAYGYSFVAPDGIVAYVELGPAARIHRPSGAGSTYVTRSEPSTKSASPETPASLLIRSVPSDSVTRPDAVTSSAPPCLRATLPSKRHVAKWA